MTLIATFTLDDGRVAEVYRKGSRYSMYIGGERDWATVSNIPADQMMRLLASYATHR